MLYPIYLRGQAHRLAHDDKEAAEQFRKIIEHNGIVLNFPLGALARLGLARAYALSGDTTESRPNCRN
jgi:eukaryotic-like serine/threonine-protein kinase